MTVVGGGSEVAAGVRASEEAGDGATDATGWEATDAAGGETETTVAGDDEILLDLDFAMRGTAALRRRGRRRQR